MRTMRDGANPILRLWVGRGDAACGTVRHGERRVEVLEAEPHAGIDRTQDELREAVCARRPGLSAKKQGQARRRGITAFGGIWKRSVCPLGT
jgi:hypothetical protein